MAVSAAAGALWIWGGLDGDPLTLSYLRDHAAWFLMAAAWLLLSQLAYRSHASFFAGQTFTGVARAVITCAGLYLVIYFLAPRELLPRIVVVSFLVLVGVMTMLWRFTHQFLSTRDTRRIPVAVVGTGSNARTLADLLQDMAPHKKVVAFVDDGASGVPAASLTAHVIASANLGQLAVERRVSELLIAPDGEIGGDVHRTVVRAQEHDVHIVPLHEAYEELLHRLPIRYLEPSSALPLLAQAARVSPVAAFLHRMVDVLAGLMGCAALLVLLPVIGPAVWLDVGRPIIFRQQRVGRSGRTFGLVKFRTMPSNAEPDGPQWARANDPRTSWFGRLLRRTHADEIPQFWNVLRGEMSLVGPRPERPEFVEDLARRIPYYRERLLVRPGLTGWAQVNYRYGSSVDDAATKLEYDLYYIKHRSPWFDALIAWQTVWTIVGFGGR